MCCHLIQLFVTLNPRLRKGGVGWGGRQGRREGGVQQAVLAEGSVRSSWPSFSERRRKQVADGRLSVRIHFVDLRPDKMELSPVLLLPAVLACLFLPPTSCDEQRLPEGTDRRVTATPTSRCFPTTYHFFSLRTVFSYLRTQFETLLKLRSCLTTGAPLR